MKNIGVTLLYCSKKAEVGFAGILKSYILEYSQDSYIDELAKQKANDEIKLNPEYNYLGINDLFRVKGNFDEYSILSRISYFDFNTIEQAKTLILKRRDYPFSEIESKGVNIFASDLIYFFEDKSNSEENFTFIIRTLNSSLSIAESKKKAISIATHSQFLSNVSQFFYEEGILDFHLENLKFIGVQKIYPIFINMQKAHCFEELHRDFNSIEDVIADNLLTQDSIKRKFESISHVSTI